VFWSGPAERSSKLLQACRKWGLAIALASGVVGGTAVSARPLDTALPSVALAELPDPAKQAFQRITSGGPFSHRQDGVVFGNRERRLPMQPRGYYREYTVETPGAPNRGARRIVCGGAKPTDPEACYYTADHYASFRRILP